MLEQTKQAQKDLSLGQGVVMDEVKTISDLMNGFTVEVTPKGALKIEDFRTHLQVGTRVYVTSLPGTDFNETLATCKRLHEQGMKPVPHFTARGIPNKSTLRGYIDRATSEAGVESVLALGGADREPAGEFEDSAAMLETGLFDQYGIKNIGISGHPEGSPDIEKVLLREYGQRKIRYADLTGANMYMVTQFVFEAQPVFAWLERIRSEGNQLPLVVGVPGPASLKSLLGHATNCGVGPSIKFLTKQARNVHKLLMMQTPDKLVRDLANYAHSHPEMAISGLHMFTLGAFPATAKWATEVSEKRFELNDEGFQTR